MDMISSHEYYLYQHPFDILNKVTVTVQDGTLTL